MHLKLMELILFNNFFYYIPNLKVLFVLGLVGTLLSFNIFDIIWLISKRWNNATTTLPLLIYETRTILELSSCDFVNSNKFFVITILNNIYQIHGTKRR